MAESRRLGRGLESLLGPVSKSPTQAAEQTAAREVPVGSIDPNPFQPRRDFDPQALQDLTDSIAASGLIQPLVVRPTIAGRYQLIAGERRWRAIQRLGWQSVPVVTKDVDDRGLLTLALIENLQRDDLSPIDEALGYERLIREFELAQAEVARLVGRDRATVANTLRLLKLPDDVRSLVQTKALTEGHARALLALGDNVRMSRFARATAEQGWSVRDLEARVRGEVPGKKAKAKPPERQMQPEVRRIEEALRHRLQTDVQVTAKRKGRGFVTITYYSNDDLARVLEKVLGEPFGG